MVTNPVDLKEYVQGGGVLEIVMNAGLMIAPAGTLININSSAVNEKDRSTILAILKSNREETRPITDGLQEALSRAQQRMTNVYAWLDEQFTMFDRLEKMHRRLYPDAGCIRGSGCGDDLIVSCDACVKR